MPGRFQKEHCSMLTYKLEFKLDLYIAHPYWPEQDELIDIQKKSGLNFVRSEDKRESRLREYLKKMDLTMDHYRRLENLSSREWYRCDGEKSPIIIPRHQMSGALVQATATAPSGSRWSQDQLRSLILVGDMASKKTKADGEFVRYVMPKDGRGQPISNQRRLTKNEHLKDTHFAGTVTFRDDLKPQAVEDLFRHALENIGIGACRKMGYGRGKIVRFEAE
jgi:hypothetical protein